MATRILGIPMNCGATYGDYSGACLPLSLCKGLELVAGVPDDGTLVMSLIHDMRSADVDDVDIIDCMGHEKVNDDGTVTQSMRPAIERLARNYDVKVTVYAPADRDVVMLLDDDPLEVVECVSTTNVSDTHLRLVLFREHYMFLDTHEDREARRTVAELNEQMLQLAIDQSRIEADRLVAVRLHAELNRAVVSSA